jgi:HEPN domain-containing protein
MPLTPADAYRMAQGYFDEYFESATDFQESANDAIARSKSKLAAFLLHQTAERLYICFLLVQTLYFPRSHNIKFLRSLAEDKEPRLVDAWPRATRFDRGRFERLKRAYVEARYSPSYAISADDLAALAECIASLRTIVEAVCEERLATLRDVAAE